MKLDSALRDCANDSSIDEAEPDPSESIDDEGRAVTGTTVIERCQLKGKASANPGELTSTGLFPKIVPVPKTQVLSFGENSISSLEMAIEVLNLPSVPLKW